MSILIADNIRSLHNVGAFFRTCDGLSVDQIFLCGTTGKPPRKEITKTALGAEEVIPWKYFEYTADAVMYAKKEGCTILALEVTKESKNIREYRVPQDWALVVGHEIMGVGDDILKMCDEVISIPMHGVKQSFNVSVATGIALFALTE